MNRVAIITDQPGWHGRRLKAALANRGVEASYVALSNISVDTRSSPFGLRIPGFRSLAPAGVFVRGVAAGSFEQVTLRLSILHTLSEAGVPVFNSAAAIEKSVDKARTSLLLARAGIPTPPAWVVEAEAKARAIAMAELNRGHSLVMKPLFGSQGEGVVRIDPGMALPSLADYNGVAYLQRFIPAAGEINHDYRVLVAGGGVVAAMMRRGQGWLNNVSQGAQCHAVVCDAAMQRIAIDATQALGLDYAGVDLIRDRANRLSVIEVNGVPAWAGLQGTTSMNVAQALADAFIERLSAIGLGQLAQA